MKILIRIILITSIIMFCLQAIAFAQTFNLNIRPTAPESKFTDNQDGTVTDLETGLMWKKSHEIGSFTWQGALQMVQTLNSAGGFAGYTDWRLPNVKELRSIVEEQCYNPAINLAVFPQTPSGIFLSSSPCAGYGSYAWSVEFEEGYVGGFPKNKNRYVRLVRDAQ